VSLNTILEAFEVVRFSYNNGVGEFYSTPKDPYFTLQWGMNNSEYNSDINAPEAWDKTHGSTDCIIGIIDTGVDQDHPEFEGRISGEDCFSSQHGTGVAGVAAAKGDNGIGIAGVTWNSAIYSKNVSGYDDTDIYNAVIDAVTNGNVDVINLSWGSLGYTPFREMFLGLANELGVLIVAARGDQGNDDAVYPACYLGDWILSVGALDRWQSRSPFSSYGYGMDIMAPGGSGSLGDGSIDDIYTTHPSGSYYYTDGASFAAPLACGLVGLLKSYNQLPAYGSNFRNIIINTARDIYDTGYDDYTGYGLLDANAALEYISRPKVIYTCESNSFDPYVYNVSSVQIWYFRGNREDLVGEYYVKIHEVRETVCFIDCEQIDHYFYDGEPVILGIDCLTAGWAYTYPCNGIKKCYVVDDNTTPYTATLKTYVYEIVDEDGDHIRYYPCAPEDVVFGYTVIYNETPDSPRQLSVTANANYNPYLTWHSPSITDNVTAYNIYRYVHGVDEEYELIATVPHSGDLHHYTDTEYSTPHTGPIAYWYDDADYTVATVNEWGNESERPSDVTIEVVVPARPETPSLKQALEGNPIPDCYNLSSAYPNPFNATTTIKYDLPEDAYVTIDIININGQKVERIVSERQNAGYKQIIWNASETASGIYFCKITANDFMDTKRLTLLK